ncbi:GNAT family N-acetyltransferase [Paraclostridium sordellii]|uniref:Acetyltransferase n=1 Tax=Paraclostridium sordellii TaxID=1505 RepID=A0A0C7QHN7_PARSO|nr:GNAT family protein [Paeniclostridium sordellii]CEN22309.1 acetyltransferase [[Clostridium] sordellii] [Paeniclostridium sordellii]CEN79023.1 acetyltransferase [[Clostridium] sordellii] [Paeniclostridium sordellii]CEP39877.1 acetyltransferase [[Clostridium] sordellii] [Paeniclostridium sordellii]CEP96178.1 acetyltransferase [[Clostridium] sordellii] [Paeniclostridium sordellii]CEQ00352.1 acetyltransferase [[Clostridium] sordellii] [Paeniclostridium sordellii]
MENIFENLPNLYTNRIRLRRINKNDLEQFFSFLSNDNVTRYMIIDKIQDIKVVEKMMNFMIEGYKNNRPTPWAISLKENDEMIGICGFSKCDIQNGKAEVGYILSDKHWRQGIATEALKVVVDFAFNYMNLNKIEARCISKNLASEKVMLKANMKLDAILREEKFHKQSYVDLKLYSILKEEYVSSDLYNYKVFFNEV